MNFSIIYLTIFAILLLNLTDGRIIKQKIIYGDEVGIIPYNVQVLTYRDSTEDVSQYGGGTIISDRHVLTAAQLVVDYTSVQIGYGSNLQSELTIATAADVKIHPQYDPQFFGYDIAVLTIANVHWDGTDPNVAPIAWSFEDLHTDIDQRGIVAGFGITSYGSELSPQLKQGRFIVDLKSSCDGLFFMQTTHFCAVGDGAGFCDGDQGAGFVSTIDGKDEVVGIASITWGKCSDSYAYAFTRVGQFGDWISSIIN